MKKSSQLIRCMFFGSCHQKPVHRKSVNTFSKSLLNVENFSGLWSFTRKFSVDCTLKTSSSTESLKPVKYGSSVNAPDKDVVIYYGGLTAQVKGVKIFTCTSSLGGLVIQPMLLQNIWSGKDIPLTVALGTTIGFFTFITPFLIHNLTKKYITEISYNAATDTYTATTLSFFLRRLQMEFKLEDVSIPQSLPMFTSMVIKGKPVFLASDSFLVIDHYIRLMGYDKPIDLKLNVPFDKDIDNQLGKNKSVASHSP